MSLVTRCPACATQFKVVRDQLRISDGWVRCGRCSEVFDATTDLHEAAEEAPAAPPAPKSEPPAAGPEREHASESESESESEPEPEPEPGPERDFAETDFFDDEQELEEAAPAELQAPMLSAASVEESEGAASESSEVFVTPEVSSAPEAPMAPEAPGSAESPEATEATQGTEAFDLSAHWPEAEALLLGERGRTALRPPVPPPLAFPALDLSLPHTESLSDRAALAGDSRAGAEIGNDQEEPPDNAQFAKALRRARVKSAKIAKARARAQKAETDRAPLVLASESESAAALPAVGEALSYFGAAAIDSPAKRWWPGRPLLIVIAAVAALLLVVQVLHQERDLIAARQPSMRPLLSGLCAVLGCEIAPLRSIDDIKIDGASFTHAQSGDGYLLSFTLRNIAKIPLAMPAVELSLLDTQERAVVRRVLQPSEFGAPAVLSPGSERAASLALNLTGPEAAALPPVAGFRVEAFYP